MLSGHPSYQHLFKLIYIGNMAHLQSKIRMLLKVIFMSSRWRPFQPSVSRCSIFLIFILTSAIMTSSCWPAPQYLSAKGRVCQCGSYETWIFGLFTHKSFCCILTVDPWALPLVEALAPSHWNLANDKGTLWYSWSKSTCNFINVCWCILQIIYLTCYHDQFSIAFDIYLSILHQI